MGPAVADSSAGSRWLLARARRAGRRRWHAAGGATARRPLGTAAAADAMPAVALVKLAGAGGREWPPGGVDSEGAEWVGAAGWGPVASFRR